MCRVLEVLFSVFVKVLEVLFGGRDKYDRPIQTTKTKETLPPHTRTIYDIFKDFKNALSKEGLIKGDDIYSLRANAKQTFLKEVQKILNSDKSVLEKREELINLFHNWRENTEIKNLLEKTERILHSFQTELKEKRAEDLPLLLSRYDATAGNAYEALKKLLLGLIEDGIASGKDVIKVRMEFLEKDTDEKLIKERIKAIRQKVEEELRSETTTT